MYFGGEGGGLKIHKMLLCNMWMVPKLKCKQKDKISEFEYGESHPGRNIFFLIFLGSRCGRRKTEYPWRVLWICEWNFGKINFFTGGAAWHVGIPTHLQTSRVFVKLLQRYTEPLVTFLYNYSLLPVCNSSSVSYSIFLFNKLYCPFKGAKTPVRKDGTYVYC